MWVPFSASTFLASGSMRILSCILISSIFVNGSAIPVRQHDALQLIDGNIASIPASEVVHSIRSIEDDVQDLVARARVRKPTRARPKKSDRKSKPTRGRGHKRPTTKPKPKTKPKPAPKQKQKLEDWQKPVPAQSTIDRLCKVPKNKALFWSGTREKAYAYRDSAGLISDKTAYPSGYTWRYRKADGSARDSKKDLLFAKRFSIAFAKKASGIVYLMVPWETGPKSDGYFHTVEWPILKKSLKRGRVTKIIQVNPDNYKETREYNPNKHGLSKRAAEIDFDDLSWDVDLDALAEKWEQMHKEKGQ